jgi:hypothetical protein
VAIAFAVVLLIIGVMPMLVILRSGADRAYWMGFAVIGSLYLGLLMYSFTLEPNATKSNPFAASNLATAQLARYGHAAIYGKEMRTNKLLFTTGKPEISYSFQLNNQATLDLDQSAGEIVVGNASGSSLRTATLRLLLRPSATPAGPATEDFVNVAHALWTLLLAACGGWFARWLYQSRSRAERSTSAFDVRC